MNQSPITPLEQRAIDARNKKFGVQSLQWEPATKDNVNPVAQSFPMTDRWYQEGLLKMREKWGIDGQFACEGPLGARLEERRTTLSDALASDAQARMRHSSIKTATASYQGKQVRMSVLVSK